MPVPIGRETAIVPASVPRSDGPQAAPLPPSNAQAANPQDTVSRGFHLKNLVSWLIPSPFKRSAAKPAQDAPPAPPAQQPAAPAPPDAPPPTVSTPAQAPPPAPTAPPAAPPIKTPVIPSNDGASTVTPPSTASNTGTAAPTSAPAASPSVSSASETPAPLSKPVIAILIDAPPAGDIGEETSSVYVPGGKIAQYADAVTENGGDVKWLWNDGRSAEEMLAGVHGVLVPGGKDINPKLYGQEPDPELYGGDSKLKLAPYEFDVWQCGMVQKAMGMRLPVRGICRGMQMLQVAAKGTLIQDIRKALGRPENYSLVHTNSSEHPVIILPETTFGRQMNYQMITVRSSHHQAVTDPPAPGFMPVARAADNVIEAMEHVDQSNVIGVQFHPERSKGEVKKRFFTAFVTDAKQFQYRQAGRVYEPEGTRYYTTSPTYSFKSSAPATPEIKVEKEWEKKERVVKEALHLLDTGGFELISTDYRDAGKVISNRHDLWQASELRAKGSSDAILKLNGGKNEDLLLSLTAEGRRMLPSTPYQILDLVSQTIRVAGKDVKMADLFCTKKGWFFPRRTRLALDIQAVWAYNDSALYLTYHEDGYGKREEKITSIQGFKDHLKRLKELADKNAVSFGASKPAAAPAAAADAQVAVVPNPAKAEPASPAAVVAAADLQEEKKG